MGLFENIADRHKKQLQEQKQRNYVNSNAFNTPLYGSITAQGSGSFGDTAATEGMGNLLGTGLKLWNTFGNSGSGASTGLGSIGSAAGNYISGGSDYGTIGNAANSFIGGGASEGSAITDAIGSNGGGGFSASSAPWGMIANTGKSIYNGISGKSPKEYSDLEQSTIYPIQGAANGFSLGGPWGALGGALYGLGYSFKDDLGLKDSNFLTQLLFPIGMGDEGGLKISGEPILDIL